MPTSAQRSGAWAGWKSRRQSAGSLLTIDDSDESFGVDVDELDGIPTAAIDNRPDLNAASSSSGGEGDGTECWLQQRAKHIVDANAFTAAVGMLIILNVSYMTVQADYPNYNPWGYKEGCYKLCHGDDISQCPPTCLEPSEFWSNLDDTFLFLFTSELVLRLIAYGCKGFFCSAEHGNNWNIFDFLVVSTCWFLWTCRTGNLSGGRFVNMLRALRMLRILRFLRIFRLPCLKKLNTIVTGLIASLPVIYWIMCMLVGVMFVSAIFCTDLLGHQAEDWGPEADEITEYFGSMLKSMNTLFQFLTLADWSSITRLVAKQNQLMMFFFLGYVICAAMVILSLLTGVLADHVNSIREGEEEEERVLRQSDRKRAMIAEFRAFKEITGPFRNFITKEDFSKLLKSEQFADNIADFGVDVKTFEPDDLFVCFDRQANGRLTWQAFQMGMEELRVGITAKQVFKLEVSLRNAVTRCKQQDRALDPQTVKHVEHQLQEACGRSENIDSLFDDMSTLISEEFSQFCDQPPSRGMSR